MNKRHRREWEEKCKRCGLCCHDKELLADALVIYDTACKYLDPETKLCTVYDKRFEVAPWCTKLTPENVKKFKWLPGSCGLKGSK